MWINYLSLFWKCLGHGVNFVVRTQKIVPRNFFHVHIHSDTKSLLFVFAMPVKNSKCITSVSSPGQGSSKSKYSTWSLSNCISRMPEEDPPSRFLVFVIDVFCWKQRVWKLELILISAFFQFTVPVPRKCHYSNHSSTHNFGVIVLLKNMQI